MKRTGFLVVGALVLFAAIPHTLAQFDFASRPDYFTPTHRLTGIGVDRREISDEVLAERNKLMIESQTFSIMRDPEALNGAKRITSPKLQKLFHKAGETSGTPAPLVAAIAYLESWGVADAESPAGPRGIMQISQATARRIGLKIVYATRYHVTTERKLVKRRRGKPVMKTVKHKIPYTVLVRDERLVPEKAIPAAANYLSQMEAHFGGRDFAVFAYHCGEGCVSNFISLAQDAQDLRGKTVTVPRLFFTSSPVHNKPIYEAIQEHMARDYSPTYYFRIMRAQQLLELYRTDPDAFTKLFQEYRNQFEPDKRAPNRLSVWLKPDDLLFHSCEDLKREQGKRLVRALDKPKYFGFALRTTGPDAIGIRDMVNQEYYLQAAPPAIGALSYIAFETHRLYDAMKPKGEAWIPLEITSLVRPLDYQEKYDPVGKSELPTHCTGQVFDVAYNKLPTYEKESLNFILDDIGWDGYLGFTQESRNHDMMHIGYSPSARDFFTQIYQETIK